MAAAKNSRGPSSGRSSPASGPARDVEAEPAPKSGASRGYDHEEWLLDESLVETFPASDPIAPAVPPDDEAAPGTGS